MNRYFKYLLFLAFIGAVLLIVFLQFNSNRSINRLIEGNEKLLSDFEVKTKLQKLQLNIATLESKVRGTVISGNITETEHLAAELSAIHNMLPTLDSLANEKSIQPLIKSLNNLVEAKTAFNNGVLDSFRIKGKAAAEKLINTQRSRQITDSIKIISSKIEAAHQLTVTTLSNEADKNGMQARLLGSIMAIIAVIVSVFTFIYVSYKVPQQQQLITRLNISEK